MDRRRLDVAHREELTEHDGVLVGSAPSTALDAELVDQLRPVEEPIDDVRVAYVDDQEHGADSLCITQLTLRP